jgi:enoyl-CoA hydratase/carnithine racemase
MAAYVKIGITPDGGMTPFMAEAIPRWLFAQMVFTGDKMPVQRLYQMGVVNEITAKNEAVSSAIKMAERLGKRPCSSLSYGQGADKLGAPKSAWCSVRRRSAYCGNCTWQ